MIETIVLLLILAMSAHVVFTLVKKYKNIPELTDEERLMAHSYAHGSYLTGETSEELIRNMKIEGCRERQIRYALSLYTEFLGEELK